MKPIIGITMGDPCGIGPEVIVKGLRDKALYECCKPFVIGDFNQISLAASSFAPGLSIVSIPKASEARFQQGTLEVLDVMPGQDRRKNSPFQYGTLNPDAASLAFKSIVLVAKLALTHEIDGIATAPIHKEGMKQIGFEFPGHTEFFASVADETDFGMMMVGGGLKIMLASIHLPLKDAIAQLNTDNLIKIIRLTAKALNVDFACDAPHIALAALNPHAGEQGILGMEEKNILLPAVEAARAEGINVSGPYPADTLFYKLKEGRFDAAVALYHDQALIPIKLSAFGNAVNTTLGLSFVRTSVDHGTAFDIAGQGIADSGSLQAAVQLAAEMAAHRRSHLKR